MPADLEREIKAFLEDTFLVSFAELEPDTDLFRSGVIDSFGFVELVNFLERRFKIKITDEELTSDALISLDNITQCITDKLEPAIS
jgi:D-alanine--poly(phosphoribitol) ligase subunit 2